MELPPELVLEMGRRAKRVLRQRMRALRKALPPAQRAERSANACRRVAETPEFGAARSLGLYAASELELDVLALDALARARKLEVYYPFMDPKPDGFSTGFRRVASFAELASRGRSFLEPPPDAPVARRGDIDLVIVPAVAVSASGQRLGYGSGFYDATLPDICPPAVALGVAFDFQLLAELPSEAHDAGLQVVVTDQRVLYPSGS